MKYARTHAHTCTHARSTPEDETAQAILKARNAAKEDADDKPAKESPEAEKAEKKRAKSEL